MEKVQVKIIENISLEVLETAVNEFCNTDGILVRNITVSQNCGTKWFYATIPYVKLPEIKVTNTAIGTETTDLDKINEAMKKEIETKAESKAE